MEMKMISRKSLSHALMEATMHSSPTSSSPLRRSSIIRPAGDSAFAVNNDEAERIALRREIDSSSSVSGIASKSVSSRRSLSLTLAGHLSAPEIAERITQCIKLDTENKINAKNAFSLEMIDFMAYMVRKQDSNISNLQVASTSLDVSTKIYGYRVDGVYTDVLKITSGTDKHSKTNESKEEDDETSIASHQEGGNLAEIPAKKKKKRNKQKMFGTVESLRGHVETVNPMSLMVGNGDTQTSDMLCQVTLPIHAHSGFYQHGFNDVIVDEIEPGNIEEDSCVEVTFPDMESISEAEIAPSFSNFKFNGWSIDDEPDSELENEDKDENEDDRRFQFDLDASIPDDNDFVNGADYFDINEEEMEVDRCNANPAHVENIVDFREVVTLPGAPKQSEYNFVRHNLNIHWAGPAHWKMRQFNKLSNSITNACPQRPIKKRKEIELTYDDTLKNVIESKFALSKFTKLKAKTTRLDWQEAHLTLPEDVHYKIEESTLNLRPSSRINFFDKCNMQNMNVPEPDANYDYNNENDTSEYCADINTGDDYPIDDDNREDIENGVRLEDHPADTQTPLMDDNLVALPKLVNKQTIAYSVRAKKIDMRQLKKSIWKNLISSDDKENMDKENLQNGVENVDCIKEKKHFSDVYKFLPKILSKENADALSFPIAFVSLLHLANEKNLKLSTLPDMSDIIVEQEKEQQKQQNV